MSAVVYYVERRGKPSTWLPRQKLAEERIDGPERDFQKFSGLRVAMLDAE